MSPPPEDNPTEVAGDLGELHAVLPAVLTPGRFVPAALAMAFENSVAAIAERAGYSVQYDPSGVAAEDVFDGMTHEEIYLKVSNFDPSNLVRTADNWRNLGAAAATDVDRFATSIAGVIGDGWQGAAADAACAGVKRYSVSAINLMIASHQFASKFASADTGLERTKSTIAAPEPITKGDKLIDIVASVGNLVAPGSMKTAQFVRDEAEEQARTVMRTVYRPAIHEAGTQIPVLPRAVDPTSGSDGLPGTGGASGSSGRSGFSPYGPSSSSAPYGPVGSGGSELGSPPSTQTSPGSGTAVPADALSAQDTATTASSWAPTESGLGSSPGTSAAAATQSPSSGTGTPGGAGTSGGSMIGGPVNGSPDSRSRGFGNRGGGAGSGFGGAGGSGLTGAPLGGSGLGGSPLGGPQLGGAGGATSSGLGASAAQGRPGAPGMGAMGPGAGRGGPGGGDDVHKTPGYLIDAVNGDELIGTLPLVAPPVLGE
ncbi:PPE domain-containing protein [Rhodococcoides yunnanense]|uniref:PPE domain-containing protein n=1 Tax=Rhodococcoides yunnanense TaxID=278209 RepID=UPI000933287B|nr:PPE domain-containing protein [Rhodococcus yunnanensis]